MNLITVTKYMCLGINWINYVDDEYSQELKVASHIHPLRAVPAENVCWS